MIETCAMETRDGGGNSLCPCVSPLHPRSFWRPLIISGACYLGYTDPKLHWPCWILWLGLCSDMPLLISVRQTLSSLWQGECLMSQQFYQTWSCVLLMLFCDRFCLSFQWESCSIFKVIEQGLHLSQSQGISFAVMKNVTSISLWLNQEYNFILTQWILACLAGAWK